MLDLVYDSSTIIVRICIMQCSNDGFSYAASSTRLIVKKYYFNYLTEMSIELFENQAGFELWIICFRGQSLYHNSSAIVAFVALKQGF